MKITFVRDGDNYEAVYIDGKVAMQCHSIDKWGLIDIIRRVLENTELKFTDLQFEEVSPDEDWVEEVVFAKGSFPNKLSDVKRAE